MIASLRFQFKIMVFKKGFKISFTLMMLLSIGCILYYSIVNLGNDISNVISPRYAYMFYNNQYSSILMLLIPIISMLPFSSSFFVDSKLNYNNIIISKIGIWRYYISKGICCMIGSFLIFFIPLIINILLNQLVFPESGMSSTYETFFSLFKTQYSSNEGYRNASIPMLNLYITHPQLYNLLFAFLISLFSSICSLLSYSLTFFMKKYPYLSSIPMIIIMFLGYKHQLYSQSGYIPIGKYINLSLSDYFIVNSLNGKYYYILFGFLILILLLSIILIYIGVKKHHFLFKVK